MPKTAPLQSAREHGHDGRNALQRQRKQPRASFVKQFPNPERSLFVSPTTWCLLAGIEVVVMTIAGWASAHWYGACALTMAGGCYATSSVAKLIQCAFVCREERRGDVELVPSAKTWLNAFFCTQSPFGVLFLVAKDIIRRTSLAQDVKEQLARWIDGVSTAKFAIQLLARTT